MIRMKVSTKIDKKGLRRLQRQLKNVSVDVGYIDSKNHWMSVRDGDPVPVAQVAMNLHYWSPWADSFMLSEQKKSQVQSIVSTQLKKLGFISVAEIAKLVGEQATNQIEVNIKGTSSPSNSEGWAEIKGFNDPLVYGSKIGEEPNLISELTFKVGI